MKTARRRIEDWEVELAAAGVLMVLAWGMILALWVC